MVYCLGMKQNPFQTMVAAAAVLSIALAPASVFARELELRSVAETPEVKIEAHSQAKVSGDAATFCSFIKDKSVDDFRHFGERADKMTEHREKRDGVIAELRAKIDGNREENRGERQAKMDDMMARWESNAKTDAEKSALAQFKLELQAAVGDRQAGVDGAVSTARDSRDDLRSETRAAIDAEVAKLQDAIKAALDRAQSDCDKNISSATVRTNFAADVKTATDAFKKSVADIKANAKTDATVIRDDRKSELESNRAEFRGFFQSLRERFKSLFGIKAKGEVKVGAE